MCELMAMSFDEPVSADFSLGLFAARGEENPDGWGLGWYPDQSLALVKEPLKWGESRTAGFLQAHPTILSRTFLAHVRHKTMGGSPTHADTHPFRRELDGREYCFAHNGTLDGPAWDLPLGRFRPLGATDSERYLLPPVGRRSPTGAAGWIGVADWRWLHESLGRANALGKLNVLFSDGRRLFVYHDLNGWKGLNFRKVRVRAGQRRHFEDDDLAVAVEGEEGQADNHGFVVATCP